MRGRDAVGVEHAGGVGDQVGAGVRGVAGLVGHRSAGVAVVVADHEPPSAASIRQKPSSHQSIDPPMPMIEQDRRVGRVAERLRAQLDAVRFDHPLGQAVIPF